MASTDPLPFPHCRLPCHSVSTMSQVGWARIASNLTPTRLRWRGARPLVSCCTSQQSTSRSLRSCSVGWCRLWLGSLHCQRPWCVYTCAQNSFTLFRCASPASTYSSICHWRLFAFSGSVTCALETLLRQFCPGQPTSLSAEAPRVCSQCHDSSGVSFASLQPHHWRPCNFALVASAKTGRLQDGCHGVSRDTWPRSTILESAGSRRWPTWSSPTPIIVDTTTPCSAFPSVYCWTALVSCRSIRSLELLAVGHSVIAIFAHFPSTAQDISFS